MNTKTKLFILLVFILHKNSANENEIIVRSYEFPYQASIRWNSNLEHHCSAVIINNLFLLTAGHCMCAYVKYYMFHVVAGANSFNDKGQQTSLIKKTICHDDFQIDTLRNDIALLKLSHKLVFTSRVQPLPLKKMLVPSNSLVIMAVWRFKKNFVIPPMFFKLLNGEVLNTQYCSTFFKKEMVDENNICTRAKGTTGACVGDSGSPVIYEKYLVGIVSFGKDCNTSEYPNVHTNVSRYIEWINAEIFLENDLGFDI